MLEFKMLVKKLIWQVETHCPYKWTSTLTCKYSIVIFQILAVFQIYNLIWVWKGYISKSRVLQTIFDLFSPRVTMHTITFRISTVFSFICEKLFLSTGPFTLLCSQPAMLCNEVPDSGIALFGNRSVVVQTGAARSTLKRELAWQWINME